MQRQTLFVTGLGEIPAVFSDAFPVGAKIAKITIRQKANTWLAGLSLVDVPADNLIRKPWKTKAFTNPLDPTGLVALDASVVHGAVGSSDGTTSFRMAEDAVRKRADKKLSNKKRYERKQARLQTCRMIEQGLDPKKPIPKGTRIQKSKRQEKVVRKVASFDLHALFSRLDLIHKFTTELVRSHHTIVVETLALHAMAKSLNKGFRRRFHQACMGEILRQLEYKCLWYGRTLIKVDKWFASSKRCSNPKCHQKNAALRLKDRAWTCPHCLNEHDRDENAAINLWQEGWRLLHQQQNALSCPTVGSTVAACRAKQPRLTTSSGQATKLRAVKRESSSSSPTPEIGMDPMSGVVG